MGPPQRRGSDPRGRGRSAFIAYFNHSGPGVWGIHPGASIVFGVGQPFGATFPGRFFHLGAVAYLRPRRVTLRMKCRLPRAVHFEFGKQD